MKDISLIFLVGYLTSFIGLVGGFLFTKILSKKGNRVNGGVMGFTAGLLISFVCFEMLPFAILEIGLTSSIIMLVIGVIFATIIDGKVTTNNKSSLIIAIGIMIHNFPEGLALGGVLNYSFIKGIYMALIICIHCFPEAMAIFVSSIDKNNKISVTILNKKIDAILYILILALPMGIGTCIGGVISNTSPNMAMGSLCFASGIMIYITCGEIIPESKTIYKGRMSTIGAMVGFVLGIIAVSVH